MDDVREVLLMNIKIPDITGMKLIGGMSGQTRIFFDEILLDRESGCVLRH